MKGFGGLLKQVTIDLKKVAILLGKEVDGIHGLMKIIKEINLSVLKHEIERS
ncbi:hypothetical protein VQL36_19510 [Chengkuizengella sp. SCS-71B]|uniref:hypothetical protein n=1 Tax=Chengkuizengella sp. SCS-71B TaxID=3115290 RepID=UPI0032C2306B